ncbi:MAG TPA: hypothetical protein VKZ65_04685, partial [Glycomyces sp.]|nr:hypothetical protein [Glycomyces sp.]
MAKKKSLAGEPGPQGTKKPGGPATGLLRASCDDLSEPFAAGHGHDLTPFGPIGYPTAEPAVSARGETPADGSVSTSERHGVQRARLFDDIVGPNGHCGNRVPT